MNRFHLTLIGLAVSMGCLTARTEVVSQSETTPSPVFDGQTEGGDTYPRWSIAGEWRVTHPLWTDVLTLHANGTASTARQGTTAKWTLTAEGGTPLLVLRWDVYGTESLSMVGPNHFRGQIGEGSFIDMRRGAEGVATGAATGQTP